MLLIKTNVDGSKVIKKLSRNETKQMENFKKMSKAEKKMFSVKDVPVPYYVPNWAHWEHVLLCPTFHCISRIFCKIMICYISMLFTMLRANPNSK